ncbi:MAG: hypothetical protein GOU97_02740 [Nanoarchaeota archaeon]|nr:hypothetical protein [Nanoarchaeota archaeon]
MAILLKTSSNGINRFRDALEENVWTVSSPVTFRLSRFCFAEEDKEGVAYWLFEAYNISGAPPKEAYPPNRELVLSYSEAVSDISKPFDRLLNDLGVKSLKTIENGLGALEKVFSKLCSRRSKQ